MLYNTGFFLDDSYSSGGMSIYRFIFGVILNLEELERELFLGVPFFGLDP
jgi:hypothetical protein